MKGNPDGSLSNYPSLRTLKASGFIDSLRAPALGPEARFVMGG